ncbi:epoxide hydrolase 4 [Leucoraja erinacea]|uniref:epoxide hydrolase 4 n=1 Tax=Leucoraja erinaceus TaxID=7782 RepID=UPI002457625E|nr:epoxide hydrolase 4 [Leucoraja erinacea]
MVKALCDFLMFLTRVTGKIKNLLFWALAYSFCGFCACLVLLKLLWHIIRKPAESFQWTERETLPACLNDTSLGTHCYVRIKESGLRFHYVAAGDRGKPLMLLLHGFPEFWFSWRYQLQEFKCEFRVVAVDLRGYGESDAPVGRENYQLDCLITDIKEIVDSLGYKKCVLIGHDWGGLIAWCFAIYYPEMLNRVIILNCPHPAVFSDYVMRHPSQLIKSSYFFFCQVPWLPEFALTMNDFKVLKYLFTSQSTGIRSKECRMTADEMEAYLYIFSQRGAFSGPLDHFRNVFSSLPLNQNEVVSPTLLLWGEKEGFMEFRMAQLSKSYVRNCFRLHVVPEASHWLQQDQPQLVNRLIWAFLKEGNQ